MRDLRKTLVPVDCAAEPSRVLDFHFNLKLVAGASDGGNTGRQGTELSHAVDPDPPGAERRGHR